MRGWASQVGQGCSAQGAPYLCLVGPYPLCWKNQVVAEMGPPRQILHTDHTQVSQQAGSSHPREAGQHRHVPGKEAGATGAPAPAPQLRPGPHGLCECVSRSCMGAEGGRPYQHHVHEGLVQGGAEVAKAVDALAVPQGVRQCLQPGRQSTAGKHSQRGGAQTHKTRGEHTGRTQIGRSRAAWGRSALPCLQVET